MSMCFLRTFYLSSTREDLRRNVKDARNLKTFTLAIKKTSLAAMKQ